MTTYRFDRSYTESFQVPSGAFVTFRLIRADDKQHLINGLARMSEGSRYYRFLRPKSQLSARELQYLTELDLENHVAIVVGADDVGGEKGLGVARFIRLRDDPQTADFAIVVSDEAQGLGLGTKLLERLREAALERGIRWFAAEFLAENSAVKGLLDRVFQHVQTEVAGDGVLRARIAITDGLLPGS